MPDETTLDTLLAHLDARLDAMEEKLDQMGRTRAKSMEWIGTLSEQIRSLDAFREEVRQSFEPFLRKMEGMDEVIRILRHATSDVSRRIERMERDPARRVG